MNDMKPKDEKIFFSYATVAPMGEPAYRAVQKYYEEFMEFGPPDVLWKYDLYSDMLSKEASKLLNCEAEEITYTNNTSEGIFLASESLPLDSGDKVLVLGNEYPANLIPWLKKQKDGIDVQVISGNENEQAFTSLLSVIDEETKVISISTTQYYDGFMPNIKKLSEICHEKNIFLVLDAVQQVGVRKIDLRETPCDFLACGGQKYLQAGPGSGFLYVNKSVLQKLRDTKVGIRGMETFNENSYTLRNTARRFQDGTQNLPGIVAMHAALTHTNSIGMGVIEQKNSEILHGIKAILTQYEIPFIDHGDQQGNIVSMKVSDSKALFEHLLREGIYIKAVKDVARLSFNHDSKLEDAEVLVKAVRAWMDINR